MATNDNWCETGLRVVFVGSKKQPSYVSESYSVPNESSLREGEILIKMRMATICEEDINDLKVTSGEEPRVLGHEGVGEVLCSKRSTDGATKLTRGDRIVFAKSDTCGACHLCSRGIPQRCSHIHKYGKMLLKNGSGLYGTFSHHMVIAAGTPVAKLPSNVPDLIASPVSCALANMMHVLRSCQHGQKNVAVIQGCNMSGLFLCTLLHEAGFKNIFCHDLSLNKLRLVERFQGIAVHINNSNDANFDVPGKEQADLIVNVDVTVGSITAGLKLLAPGGTYILTATDTPKFSSSSDWTLIAKKSLTIKGVIGYNDKDLEDAVVFISTLARAYPFEVLFGPVFELHNFPLAVRMAEQGTYLRTPIIPS